MRYGAFHTKGSRGPAAPTRAAARPGGSVYCACHAKGSRGPAAPTRAARPGGSAYCACHTKGSRGPAAPPRAAARPGGSVHCACHTKAAAAQRHPRAPQLDQQPLCTAPAMRQAAAPHLCFLVLSFVPQIVLFGAFPRAKNRALDRAFLCSPSCQKSCSRSCSLLKLLGLCQCMTLFHPFS